MTREEQVAVCAEFGLGESLACAPLGGTRNRNHLLRTTSGNVVVRDRYAGYRQPARIQFDHDALDFLHERGVPVAPPVPSIRGATFWQNGERLWEVFPAVPGRHFRDAGTDDIRALAEALSAFHRAGKEFKPRTQTHKLGPRGETDPAQLLDIARKLRPDAHAVLKLYEDWIAEASADLPDAAFASLPSTLIHGDIQPANILIDAGRVTALVDLDWCDHRPRIYDLAFGILLCCATHESPIGGGDIWSLSQPPVVERELGRMFLQVYDDQGWRLSSSERRSIRPQVILSWCHCRLAGALKVEPQRRREFLERPPHKTSALFPDGIT
jgi:Ser/Thr protein kinase RdoA (MazF antagonist)